ncbi:uncharacterized protein LOC119598384 [Penaeus monodon]|uniref:uncharacterized protein LOC119598384 n=1 Tax=Penaeus monodon TaxID=6687 RepID=UPI0018A79324|nr:uncharacterized protein LOC119598384 [Penaeus monodon]
MNGQVGSGNYAIRRMHGGNAYGNEDEDGEKRQNRKNTTHRRIKWYKLKENDFQQEFEDRILRELSHDMVDVNTWWNDAKDEVNAAQKRMKNGKAMGPDGIPVEVWKALGEEVDILHGLMKAIMEREAIPEKWKYQSSKRKEIFRVVRTPGQLGFMKGIGTVDGIFSLRQTTEKYQEKRRVLHLVFIDRKLMGECHAKKSGEGYEGEEYKKNV